MKHVAAATETPIYSDLEHNALALISSHGKVHCTIEGYLGFRRTMVRIYQTERP